MNCSHKDFNKGCVTCLDILNVANYAEKEGLEEFFDWSAMVEYYFKPEPDDDRDYQDEATENQIADNLEAKI